MVLKNKIIQAIYSILVIIFFSVVFFIISGSLFYFIKYKYAKNNNKTEKDSNLFVTNKKLYTGLGRLRAATDQKNSHTVIIFPILEYDSNDIAFQEEIVQKKEEIKKVILEWISEKSIFELYTMSESERKKELITRINSQLVLSKINRIFLKEFIILE